MTNDDWTILSWNILHGGGPRRLPMIALALLESDADLIVLSEFRAARGGSLAAVLADHGWTHQTRAPASARTNSILLASREPLGDGGTPAPSPVLAPRWVHARVTGRDLDVLAVHLPDDSDIERKVLSWKGLLDWSRDHVGNRAMVVGDLNTGRHHADERGRASACSAQMGRLWSMGFRDAFREVHDGASEHSWRAPTGGAFRLDHTFVSPALAPTVRACDYLHAARESGLSDHSPMRVTLRLGAGSGPGSDAIGTGNTGLF